MSRGWFPYTSDSRWLDEDLYTGYLDPHTKQIKILVGDYDWERGDNPTYIREWHLSVLSEPCSEVVQIVSSTFCEPTPLGRFSSHLYF